MIPVMYQTPTGRLFRNDFDRLFEDFFSPAVLSPRHTGFPAVNIWEQEHNYFVEAEIPGLSLEDLEISVMGKELTIRGKRPELKGEAFHRRERGVGSFTRVIQLPTLLETNAVEATLRNGILTVRLPKAEEVRPKKIQIRSAS